MALGILKKFRPNPRSNELDSLGIRIRNPCFNKLYWWFWCIVKFEHHRPRPLVFTLGCALNYLKYDIFNLLLSRAKFHRFLKISLCIDFIEWERKGERNINLLFRLLIYHWLILDCALTRNQTSNLGVSGPWAACQDIDFVFVTGCSL